jgi:hypothetical protein
MPIGKSAAGRFSLNPQGSFSIMPLDKEDDGRLSGLPPHHLERLLDEGWSLLDRGKGHEAALVFGRVLLLDASHAGARGGRERALAAAAEQDRLLAARLAEATALEGSDIARARVLVDEVLEAGGDRDRALLLLDRLDGRSGRLLPNVGAPSGAARRTATAPPPRHAWPRAALVGLWGLGFVALAAGAALSWERLVTGLTRAPSPTTAPAPPSTEMATPSLGERALSEARRLNAQGDVAAALAVLDRIPPEDPAYPFARQLRGEAEKALQQGRIAF